MDAQEIARGLGRTLPGLQRAESNRQAFVCRDTNEWMFGRGDGRFQLGESRVVSERPGNWLGLFCRRLVWWDSNAIKDDSQRLSGLV